MSDTPYARQRDIEMSLKSDYEFGRPSSEKSKIDRIEKLESMISQLIVLMQDSKDGYLIDIADSLEYSIH